MIHRAIRFLGSVVTGSPDEEDEPCPSLVLLLESPLQLTRESVLKVAAETWGEPGSEISIARRASGWFIRISEVPFALRTSRHRYRRREQETNEARQRVWDRHRAWLAVDYPDGPRMPVAAWSTCYKLLFLMANQIWNDNCLGLYLPAQRVTVPNMGDLIGSIRWAANNGTPLAFLHEEEQETQERDRVTS